MKKKFSIKTIFNESWSDYKQNWKLFLLIGIIFLLIGLVSNLGTIDPASGVMTQSPIVSIVGWALQTFIALGFIKFLLNIIDKKPAKIEQLFNGANSLLHYVSFVVVTLLVSVISGIIALPLVLSFVFGFFSPISAWIVGIISAVILVMVSVGLMFARYLAAEQKFGIFESLKESWKGTRSSQWKILLFIIVVGLFNLLGFAAFILGLIITIPMSLLMYARLYRTLFNCECVDEICVCTDSSIEESSDSIIVEEILEGDQSSKESESESESEDK